MISERERIEALIEAWDPEGSEDLPDEVAAAMDADPELRRAFDRRFLPSPLIVPPVPEGLADRVMPKAEGFLPILKIPPESSRWPRNVTMAILGMGGLAALAASALLVVGGGTLMFSAGGANPDGFIPSKGPAVASANGTEEGQMRGVLGYSDGGVARERERLTELGYMGASEKTEDGEGRDADGRALLTLGYIESDPVEVHAALGPTGSLHEKAPGSSKVLTPRWFTTADDRLSTFSVDVDAGSYTQARRDLREGRLPPPDAVRPEEFVNYFRYEYAPPPAGEPFAVRVEAAPWPGRDTTVVRVGLQARTIPADQREPVHLTFLVDTSGSMGSEDRLPLVKRSLTMLVGELRDGDTVAIAAYAGSAGVVLEPTPIAQKAEILRAIGRLDSGGSTAMGEGIAVAYKLAQDAYEEAGVNRVIIASDGDANVGTTETGTLSEMISGYAKRGIALTTLGFGRGNYRDARMEQLADDGDGNYYFIDGEDEARRVLVDRLTSTMQIAARDVKIQVDWDPAAVRRYRLIGYENRDIADRDFRVDAVDAGEVGAGHQVTALYEVELADPAAKWMDFRLRYKPPGPDAPASEKMWTFGGEVRKATFQEAGADLRVAWAAGAFAEALRGGDVPIQTVASVLETAARAEYPDEAGLLDLVRKAEKLGVPPSAPNVRVSMRAPGAAKLQCNDGTSQRFTDAASLEFEGSALPVTCMIDMEGSRGAFQVSGPDRLVCAIRGTEVLCNPAREAPCVIEIVRDGHTTRAPCSPLPPR